jgi:2'-5' RNA ligase
MDIFSGKNGSAILLMLPQDFSSRVIEWGKDNIPSDSLSKLPNKGRDNSPHITLVSGIIDEAPEKAFKLLEKQGPFKVKLGDVDCFRKHDRGYDVVKINVESSNLEQLNSDILGSLEVNDPVNPFNPHITMAYVMPFSCEGLIGNGEFNGMEVPIDGYVYSNRETGGKVVKLGQREPLKDSLDYGSKTFEYPIQDIASHLKKNGLFVRSMSSVDIARIIISMHSVIKIQ